MCLTFIFFCTQNNKGSMPRMVDIELMDNLVNTCMPGDDITLTGIIKVKYIHVVNYSKMSMFVLNLYL